MLTRSIARDKSKSTSSCVQAIKANVDDQIPLDITLSVGVGIYATLDIDNDIFGSLYSGDISLYVSTHPLRLEDPWLTLTPAKNFPCCFDLPIDVWR